MGYRRQCALSRRSFLGAGTLTVGLGLAGCTTTSRSDVDVVTPEGGAEDGGGNGETRSSGAVYVPPHVHERAVAGTETSGEFAFGVAYSVPDYYWTVDGTTVRRVTPADGDNVQLMATAWAPGTSIVLPHLRLTATIEKDGDPLRETELTPVLNQRWGFQYLANLGLERYGELVVRLQATPGDVRRTGELRGSFGDPASVRIGFDFDRTEVQNLRTLYPREHGLAGAVEAREESEFPLGRQPNPADLPGEVVATGSSAGATFAVSAVPADSSPIGDANPYVAISAETPYNHLTLPNMRVEGSLTRGGETVYRGAFAPTLDGERGYHYGTSVDSIESGDQLALSFPTPPQVGRYEGYEEAFVEMPGLELSL